MKKPFLITLCLMLLSGCGAAQQAVQSITNNTNDSNTPSVQPSASPESYGTFNSTGSIDEQIIFQDDNVTITAKSLDYDSNTAKLTIGVENSSSKTWKILSGTLGYSCNAINDWTIPEGYVNLSVPAGKKANEAISFNIKELQALGINGIRRILMSFEIENDDDYSDRYYTDPLEITTSLSDNTDEEMNLRDMIQKVLNVYSGNYSIDWYSEEELLNSNGLSVSAAAYATSPDGNKKLLLDVKNDSDQILNIDALSFSADGFDLGTGRWTSDFVHPHTRLLMTIDVDLMAEDDEWEAMGITDISELEFWLGVRNHDYDYLNEPQKVSLKLSDTTAPNDTSGTELYNENGIRIISKGLVDAKYSSSDVNWRLFVENSNDYNIIVSDGWGDKLSINDYMIDYTMWTGYIDAGKTGIVDIEIKGNSLEASGLTKDSLGVAELQLEIKDENYHDIATPTLVMDFNAASE